MRKRRSSFAWRKALLLMAAFFLSINFENAAALSSTPKRTPMSQEEFEARKRGQDEFHNLLRQGDSFFRAGDFDRAESLYLKAYDFSKGSSSESVALGNLARFYENVGEFQKSLELTNKFLSGLSVGEPAWHRYEEMKSRLLKKIEAQKSWEAKQGPVVPKFKKGFEKASPEKQREFLEGLGGPGIMDVFKEAMVAEHGGDFKRALRIYESLLSRKADIEKEFGMDGWVMLYPAIQRNAEMLKDAPKEKEAIIWMKENLLPESARYHTALSKLMPQNVAHIEKRIKDCQL